MPDILTERPTIPREYAGRWIAWAPDGRTIVASGATLEACERAAVRAGHALNEVAIHRVPRVHQRVDEKPDR